MPHKKIGQQYKAPNSGEPAEVVKFYCGGAFVYVDGHLIPPLDADTKTRQQNIFNLLTSAALHNKRVEVVFSWDEKYSSPKYIKEVNIVNP